MYFWGYMLFFDQWACVDVRHHSNRYLYLYILNSGFSQQWGPWILHTKDPSEGIYCLLSSWDATDYLQKMMLLIHIVHTAGTEQVFLCLLHQPNHLFTVSLMLHYHQKRINCMEGKGLDRLHSVNFNFVIGTLGPFLEVLQVSGVS